MTENEPGGAAGEAQQLELRQRITLVELVDRLLNKGVTLTGDVTLAVANVDLVYLGLRLLLISAASLEERKPSG